MITRNNYDIILTRYSQDRMYESFHLQCCMDGLSNNRQINRVAASRCLHWPKVLLLEVPEQYKNLDCTKHTYHKFNYGNFPAVSEEAPALAEMVDFASSIPWQDRAGESVGSFHPGDSKSAWSATKVSEVMLYIGILTVETGFMIHDNDGNAL